MLRFTQFGKTFLLCALIAAIAFPALAEDSVMFNYQGRVKVRDHDFSGTGKFKFAILSPDKDTTLWSNDSTSSDGQEPTTGLDIEVTNGVFNVLLGENGKMDEINSTIFQTDKALRLRTWFDDGVHGFERLRPDHKLVNLNLITSQTGGDDFTIYVDGENGDDSNSGLKPDRAKKTIQAAVDIVPSRVMADVTIDIADGTYAEEVLIYGISCKPGKYLVIQGDETWTPSAGGSPKVIVTAVTDDGHNNLCLHAIQSIGIKVNGLTLTGAAASGVGFEDGKYEISNCVAKENPGTGFSFSNQVRGEGTNLVSKDNGNYGLTIGVSTRCNLTSPTLTGNNLHGLFVGDNSACGIRHTANISNNRSNGISCIAFSAIACENDYSNGTINNNQRYGIEVGWNSYLHNFSGKNTISGNLRGAQSTFNGGVLHY